MVIPVLRGADLLSIGLSSLPRGLIHSLRHVLRYQAHRGFSGDDFQCLRSRIKMQRHLAECRAVIRSIDIGLFAGARRSGSARRLVRPLCRSGFGGGRRSHSGHRTDVRDST